MYQVKSLLLLSYITHLTVATTSITPNLSQNLNITLTANKTTTTPPPPQPPPSNSPSITVSCFTQPPRPSPPSRRPVPPADYCAALQQIILRPDFLETHVWELSPDPETWLGWKSHDSGIFLGGHTVTVEAFAPAFVVQVAAVVAAECLVVEKGLLGGIARAGEGGNVLVAVGGLGYRALGRDVGE